MQGYRQTGTARAIRIHCEDGMQSPDNTQGFCQYLLLGIVFLLMIGVLKVTQVDSCRRPITRDGEPAGGRPGPENTGWIFLR
jgi:hypothetical protein